MKMYKNERDFPDDEKLQQVWLKQSSKNLLLVFLLFIVERMYFTAILP